MIDVAAPPSAAAGDPEKKNCHPELQKDLSKLSFDAGMSSSERAERSECETRGTVKDLKKNKANLSWIPKCDPSVGCDLLIFLILTLKSDGGKIKSARDD